MNPEQVAHRLLAIAEEVGAIRQLAEVGLMATHALSQEERNALAELLETISKRLQAVSADLANQKAAA